MSCRTRKKTNQLCHPHHVEELHRIVPGDMKVPRKAYLWALQNPDLSAVISEIVERENGERRISAWLASKWN